MDIRVNQLNETSIADPATEKTFLAKFTGHQELADAIPHIVWWASSAGEIQYLNRCWFSYSGLEIEKSFGDGWQKAFHPHDLPLLLQAWKDSHEVCEDFEIECRILNQQGEARWHRVKAVGEKTSLGQIFAWFGTCTDIHDLKTAQEKMNEAQKAAESASQAKTYFLANMSHEIRTPLGAMMGFTELLMDPELSDAEKKINISIVRRNSQQLLKIIDEILDISKVEAGHLEMERVETDLVTLLNEAHALLEVKSAEKGVPLKFLVKDKIPRSIWTDPTRLRQILFNIVGNAIKFTEDGEIQVTCGYRQQPEGVSYLQMSIQDSGIGIAPEVTDRLFTPFSQADSSTTRTYGGTGLGLALSRQLTRAMGGDLWLADSRPNNGSTFTFEIPAEPTATSEWMTQLKPNAFVSSDTKPLAPKGDLDGARILLVEDAEDNQVLIGHFLKKAGAVIDIANNGQEGVEKALRFEYSAVLMDIQMPYLDGYEATMQLRAAGYKKPIIALTAHALREEREKALNTGCNGHLTKPINRAELIASLKRLVES